jgi:hypothetical protein
VGAPERGNFLLFALWSPKGGSGTSVVTAALGSCLARRRPVLLVDLAGDLPAIAGLSPYQVPFPPSPGPFPSLTTWLAAGPAAPSDALDVLIQTIADGLSLLPLGPTVPGMPMADLPPESGAALAAALDGGTTAVADAGRAEHPVQRALVEVADASLMVVRGCYLALRRAVDDDLTARALGVVVVEEPGRSLGPADVADVLGCPVLATVEVNPSISRAVDAGVLLHRPPPRLSGPLRSLVDTLDGCAPGWAA